MERILAGKLLRALSMFLEPLAKTSSGMDTRNDSTARCGDIAGT